MRPESEESRAHTSRQPGGGVPPGRGRVGELVERVRLYKDCLSLGHPHSSVLFVLFLSKVLFGASVFSSANGENSAIFIRLQGDSKRRLSGSGAGSAVRVFVSIIKGALASISSST